jgi:hypothetical protein
LQETKHAYQQQTYNFITNNCHNFACLFLTQIQYASHTPWRPVLLAAELSRHSRYVGFAGFLKTWLPFCILSLLGYNLLDFWIWNLWLALVVVVSCVFVLLTLTMKQDAPAIYRASSI